jgi:hypothetical protein
MKFSFPGFWHVLLVLQWVHAKELDKSTVVLAIDCGSASTFSSSKGFEYSEVRDGKSAHFAYKG